MVSRSYRGLVVTTGDVMDTRQIIEDSAKLALGRVKAFVEVVSQY
jgi:hypothetical protein